MGWDCLGWSFLKGALEADRPDDEHQPRISHNPGMMERVAVDGQVDAKVSCAIVKARAAERAEYDCGACWICSARKQAHHADSRQWCARLL